MAQAAFLFLKIIGFKGLRARMENTGEVALAAFVSDVAAKPANTSDAFNKIYAIRTSAGMETMTYSIPLSRAAQSHASYLAHNIEIIHVVSFCLY